MKKVINAGLGGRSFTLDEDAYERLQSYLEHFRIKLVGGARPGTGSMTPDQAKEVMDDLEMRIADLFLKEVGSEERVVSLELVNRVTAQLGMPDGSAEQSEGKAYYSAPENSAEPGSDSPQRKFYRNMDDRVIAGVCSGLAAYFNIDVVIVRVLMVVLLLSASAGFWLYIIVWLVAPKAQTPAQKCEMNGLPVTAENMARFARK